MKNENAIQRYKNICAIYGVGTVNDQTCQKLFAKFHAADFSLNDAPVEINNDEMKILLENNQSSKTWEKSNILRKLSSRI